MTVTQITNMIVKYSCARPGGYRRCMSMRRLGTTRPHNDDPVTQIVEEAARCAFMSVGQLRVGAWENSRRQDRADYLQRRSVSTSRLRIQVSHIFHIPPLVGRFAP